LRALFDYTRRSLDLQHRINPTIVGRLLPRQQQAPGRYGSGRRGRVARALWALQRAAREGAKS
jgi:hypothetical protein